jgi:hypothetical protein
MIITRFHEASEIFNPCELTPNAPIAATSWTLQIVPKLLRRMC